MISAMARVRVRVRVRVGVRVRGRVPSTQLVTVPAPNQALATRLGIDKGLFKAVPLALTLALALP